ncbi:MAG: antibiotic biosynthesis monooxygenase family protein [Steroidobacteraceae bacterium]
MRVGQSGAFEDAFRGAQHHVSQCPGYVSHELRRCIETAGRYALLVRWESVSSLASAPAPFLRSVSHGRALRARRREPASQPMTAWKVKE